MAADKDVWLSSQIQNNIWALSSPTFSCQNTDVGNAYVYTPETYNSDTPDQLIWKAGSSAFSTVHSQYKLLQPLQPHDKVVKYFWKAKAPLKVKITT